MFIFIFYIIAKIGISYIFIFALINNKFGIFFKSLHQLWFIVDIAYKIYNLNLY